jgi:NADH dehydrogenase (ubiquinone) Fe-S protein 1
MDSLASSSTLCLINDQSFHVARGSTILQACEQAGFLIPRFCYHECLSIAGNCRMCLVQLDKSAKPVASCALEVVPGMRVYTNTNLVKKAREGVMEFLLANHPLDCPICDQGGECDLQDQALIFGNDRGRFYEVKRAVSDKDWGPLIKTVMTRCIHCTRCQRFSSELSGEAEIGMVGRGVKSEITNLLGNFVLSEVSANVIDLCPVGALTSKPYAFTARPWELTRLEGIDFTDSLASNLSYHVANQRVLRILPVLHQKLNEEWLSNRARFVYDGFRLQRLTSPAAVRDKSLTQLSWSSTFFSTLFSVGPFFSTSFAFGELPLQSCFYLKKLSTFSPLSAVTAAVDYRDSCFVQPSYSSVSDSDLVVVVGAPLKRDLPLLLLRLRFEQGRRDLPVLGFGFTDLSLKSKVIGVTFTQLLSFLMGRHVSSALLRTAKKPVFIISTTFFNSFLPDFNALKRFCLSANSRAVFLPLPSPGRSFNNSAEVGLITPNALSPLPSAFSSLSVNESPFNGEVDAKSYLFVNSYGFDSLIRPNLILLPISNSIESTGYTVNLEGRLQVSRAVLASNKLLRSSGLSLLLLACTIAESSVRACSLSFDTELVRNALTFSSFFIPWNSTVVASLLPFFNSISSLYQTTAVTYVSPVLVNLARTQRSANVSSFPTL